MHGPTRTPTDLDRRTRTYCLPGTARLRGFSARRLARPLVPRPRVHAHARLRAARRRVLRGRREPVRHVGGQARQKARRLIVTEIAGAARTFTII